MFNRRLIAILVLFCCFFEGAGKNTNDSIGKKLGKPVHTFILVGSWGATHEKFCYTTELSRILLVGEPKAFEFVRSLPMINELTNPIIDLGGLLFNNRFLDNRFENFIKNAEKFSQRQLQEAVEDAILLSSYNTKAYWASTLLDYLVEALQNKIAYTKNQVEHDFKWDQTSVSSMKKSVAWVAGLMAIVAITNTYEGESVDVKGSNASGLNAIASLGLLPASYKTLKNGYKMLTTNPNACNRHLDKYEELLAFVQKLKAQLETNGSITFKLPNGRIATVKNHGVVIGDELIFD